MTLADLTPEQLAELEAIAADEPERPSSNGADPWALRQPLELDPDAEPEPPDYLVDARLERGTVTVLAGDTGAAKSFTAQSLTVATVEGADTWLGRDLRARHRRAIVVDEENPERLVRARLRALGLRREGASRLRYFHRLGARLGEGDWLQWLAAELAREAADLLVIDTGTAAVAADLDDNTEVAAFYRDGLRPLAAQSQVAVMLLLHERKPSTQGGRGPRTMATLGARSWIGQADAQLMLARRGESNEARQDDGTTTLETRFTLEVGKLRDGGAEKREIVCIASVLNGRRALLRAEVTVEEDLEPKESVADQVAGLLGATPGMTLAQLEEETGYSDRTIRDALKAIDADGEGRPKRWHLPAEAQEAMEF